MYWLDMPKLAENLREGRVDEKDRFKYYLASITTVGIVVPLFFYSVGPLDVDRLICFVLSAITGVAGIILCYRANKSGDNIDFIPRMICLGWTAAISVLSIFYLIPLVISLVAAVHKIGSYLSYVLSVRQHFGEWRLSIVCFSGMPVLVAIYYGFVYFYVARVAQAKEGQIFVEIFETKNLSFRQTALALLVFPGSGFVYAGVGGYILRHVGVEIVAHSVGLLVSALWLILLGWLFAVMHKRSTSPGC